VAITSLVIPYPDFKLNDIIDPDEHDLNNASIVNKINQIRVVVNQITDGVAAGQSGADAISLTPIAPFTSNKLQTFLADVITRLRSNTAGTSGSEFIGSPTIGGVSGNTVSSQLISLKALLDAASTAYNTHRTLAVLDHPDASVTTAKIRDQNVTTSKIADANVTTQKVADANITTAKIADQNVTTGKIADAGVTEAKIASGAVTTTKIPDGNITTPKIAALAVDGTKIANNAVITSKISDGAVTGAKILQDSIEALHLRDNSVTGTKIGPSAVSTQHITNQSVTDVKIADGAVTGGKIAPNAITNDKIAAGTISADKLDFTSGDLSDVKLASHNSDIRSHNGILRETSSLYDAANKIYRVVDFKREDGTMYMKSTLSNVNGNGDYLTDTWEFYDTSSFLTGQKVVWTFIYDTNHTIINKTPVVTG
jgi:hypothetical protein